MPSNLIVDKKLSECIDLDRIDRISNEIAKIMDESGCTQMEAGIILHLLQESRALAKTLTTIDKTKSTGICPN